MKPSILVAGLGIGAVVTGLGFANQGKPPQSDRDVVLEAAVSYLKEDPVDGRFGASRIPQVHGPVPTRFFSRREDRDDPRLRALRESWLSLYKSDEPTLMVVSRVHRRSFDHSFDDRIRVHENALRTQKDYDREATLKLSEQIIKISDDLMKSTRARREDVVEFAGQNRRVTSVGVFATNPSCYKCHQDVPTNQPIGVVSLLTLAKD